LNGFVYLGDFVLTCRQIRLIYDDTSYDYLQLKPSKIYKVCKLLVPYLL
jgi:hypothetical protein